MINLFRKLNIWRKKAKTGNRYERERKILERKVEEGAERAIKEYGEVFKRLAEYDKA